MSDPSVALQAAIVAVLKQADVVAGDRVYGAVPNTPTFPYITVGDDQVLGDDTECGEGSEVFIRIHGWSRAVGVGPPEIKTMAAAIRTAIRAATPLTFTGFTVVVTEFVQSRFLQEPDGLTRHSVTEFRFLITHD